MTKSCVVFAISVDSEDRLFVVTEFLDMIKARYSDCDVYIGINYGSHDKIESIIESYNLNAKYRRLTDPFFHTRSDDSAYQIALSLLHESKKTYDVCWFVHTKGGFNGREEQRKLYIEDFYSRRDYIESKFGQLPHLGVFGYRSGVYWVDHTNPVQPHITNSFMRNIWSEEKNSEFKYDLCKVIIIETMFALRGELIHNFLNKYEDFFTSKLRMFFFECEISNLLSSKQGYYQGLVDKRNWATKESMKPLFDEWIETNKLYHLKNYFDLI